MGWSFPVLLTVLCAQLSAGVPDGDIQVIDVLSLQDSKQSVAAVEKLSGSLSALSDIYVVSTFRLPVKMGGVLFGLYSKQDNRKYLEVAVMGKISKGWWKFNVLTCLLYSRHRSCFKYCRKSLFPHTLNLSGGMKN
ncbi:Thrombospondin-3a [Xenotaenia resolanae]|uniref:Thrombospondin-3a n=1 Tax=Xenotaenia resolanae TaxID=208358 RepID=A0ABV0WGE6_9TELE